MVSIIQGKETGNYILYGLNQRDLILNALDSSEKITGTWSIFKNLIVRLKTFLLCIVVETERGCSWNNENTVLNLTNLLINGVAFCAWPNCSYAESCTFMSIGKQARAI